MAEILPQESRRGKGRQEQMGRIWMPDSGKRYQCRFQIRFAGKTAHALCLWVFSTKRYPSMSGTLNSGKPIEAYGE